MLIHDRVLCDCCGDDMGQIIGGITVSPGHLPDKRIAPHFAVCPDCMSDVCDFLGLPQVITNEKHA